MPLITRLISRSREILFRSVAHPNANISPLTILFGEILFLGVIGGTLIVIFHPEGMGYIYYDKGYPFISYLSILYGSLVLGAISFGLGLRKRLLNYATRNCLTPSASILLLFWWFTFFAAFGCFIWLFAQAGMKHPLISALRSENVFQVITIRSDIAKVIDMGVYNLGLICFLPLNLIISVFLLRKILLSIASVCLLFVLGTFTLAKAPLAYVLIFVLVFKTVYSPLYLRAAISYLSIIILSLVLLFVSTGYAGFSIQSVVKNISDRILYGQILDLPYYFEVFSNQKIGLKSLMPPYIVSGQKPPARIVAEYSVEKRSSRSLKSLERYSAKLSDDQLIGTYVPGYGWEGKKELGFGAGRASGIDGLWVINAGNAPGKLELRWIRNKLGGRIFFDVAQRWENLYDVIFDPDAETLEFTRTISNGRYEQYYGTLSGDQLSGYYAVRGVGGASYAWMGTQKRRPELNHASRIDGLWLINAGKATGKLELYWTANRLHGRIWFNVYEQWEDLSDVVFDPQTGQLEFARSNAHKAEKAFYARVAGVANTFFTGEAFAWAGYLGVILSPFIIMAHISFFIYLFGKMRKTWFSVYIFSFLLYKTFIGIFGGISYFIFSSIHIVLIAFLLLLIFWRYFESKNIPFFNKVAEKLCIL